MTLFLSIFGRCDYSVFEKLQQIQIVLVLLLINSTIWYVNMSIGWLYQFQYQMKPFWNALVYFILCRDPSCPWFSVKEKMIKHNFRGQAK